MKYIEEESGFIDGNKIEKYASIEYKDERGKPVWHVVAIPKEKHEGGDGWYMFHTYVKTHARKWVDDENRKFQYYR